MPTDAGALALAVAPNSPALPVASGEGAGTGATGGKQAIADAPTGASLSAGSEAQPLPAINSARVLQSMQGSEMRVGMHSAEFGNVSVSTSLNRESIAAQISFEHMDLGRVLSTHLPAIEAKLSSEYGVPARVEIRDQSAAPSGESGRGESGRGESGRGGDGSRAHGSSSAVPYSEGVGAPTTNSSLAESFAGGQRLDIHG